MPFAVRKNRIGKETYMKETELVERKIVEYFTKDTVFKEITPKEYADFSYPRRIRLMNFTTRLYRVYGFGHLMTMRTDTRFGMQLLTCSFMPSEGKNVQWVQLSLHVILGHCPRNSIRSFGPFAPDMPCPYGILYPFQLKPKNVTP